MLFTILTNPLHLSTHSSWYTHTLLHWQLERSSSNSVHLFVLLVLKINQLSFILFSYHNIGNYTTQRHWWFLGWISRGNLQPTLAGPGRAPQENFGIFECMKSDLRPFAQQVYNVELFTANECLQILQVGWALTKLKLCVPHTLATSVHNDAHINGYAISLEAGDLSSPPSSLPF